MPNIVAIELMFDKEHSEKILSECKIGENCFDFNSLIPEPPDLFRGNLDRETERAHPHNWLTWRKKHWGTRWNSFECSTRTKSLNNHPQTVIAFQTAWTLPAPIFRAFIRKYRIPFYVVWYEDMENFWGMASYEILNNQILIRGTENDPEHKLLLADHLWNYSSDKSPAAIKQHSGALLVKL